jgi:hypothetical protein
VRYNKESDTTGIEFDTERDVIYTYKVEDNVKANKLKLAVSTERSIQDYEEVCQVGALVEMKWEEDELGDTDWTPGTRSTTPCVKTITMLEQ